MRIISKFVDFYDSMARYGQDLSRVWLRQTVFHEFIYDGRPAKDGSLGLHPELATVIGKARASVTFTEKKEFWHREPELVLIVFAGKAYPVFIQGYTTYEDWILSKEKPVTTWNAPEKFKLYRKDLGPDMSAENIALYYERVAPTLSVSADVFLYYQSPILLVQLDPRGNPQVIANPQLKAYLFQTQMDIHSCWQALQHYLFNDMTVGDVYPPSKQTDKEKVLSHGFDATYGFRKRPKVTG